MSPKISDIETGCALLSCHFDAYEVIQVQYEIGDV